MDPVVICEGLSKRYYLGEERDAADSVREVLLRLGRRREASSQRDEIWALRDFDLEVAEGEVLGLVGRNGAGKSTLLKILARITEPTAGRARIRGRVGALLEVGTAFDAELTGRENVLINGALLGLSRRDVIRRFDDIIDFAGVGAFIDTPVKRYSSGMYLRLAFSVAAHLEPEIMIVDEVLAVGDAEFQRRCLTRMSELGRDGRTVLYVSHDLGSLNQLTSRCVWIDRGKIRADGASSDVIAQYLHEGVPAPEQLALDQRGPARLQALEILDATGQPTTAPARREPLVFRLILEHEQALPRADVALWILDDMGRRVFDEAYRDAPSAPAAIDAAGRHEITLTVPPLLPPGEFVAGVWLGTANDGTFLDSEVLRFEIRPSPDDPPDAATRSRAASPPVAWAHRPG